MLSKKLNICIFCIYIFILFIHYIHIYINKSRQLCISLQCKIDLHWLLPIIIRSYEVMKQSIAKLKLLLDSFKAQPQKLLEAEPQSSNCLQLSYLVSNPLIPDLSIESKLHLSYIKSSVRGDGVVHRILLSFLASRNILIFQIKVTNNRTGCNISFIAFSIK